MKFQGKDGTLRIYEHFGNYVEVHFRNLDFTGPMGRPKLEEQLVLDNGIVNEFAHYINTSDMVIYDPVPLSFSFFTDDKCTIEGDRNTIYQALICRHAQDADLGTWSAWGRSTKGSTQNDGATDNPKFTAINPSAVFGAGTVTDITYTTYTNLEDTSIDWGEHQPSDMIYVFDNGVSAYCTGGNAADAHFAEDLTAKGIAIGTEYAIYENMRTVDIQFKLTSLTGINIVWKFAEVYFPPNEIAMAEAEDSINVTASGGCYGTITRGTDWL